MDDDEDGFESLNEMRQRRHEQYIAAGKQAEIEAGQIDWPEKRTPLNRALSNLGNKIGDEYLHIINDEMTENITTAAMNAERLLWTAERQGELTEESLSGFSSTSSGFFNFLSLLSDDGEKQIPAFEKWYEPMQSIAVVFFNQADALMGKSHINEALDKVAEAFLAMGLHDYMLWHEIGGDDSKSSQAKKGYAAMSKNDPKLRAKAYIKDCWTKGRSDGTLCGRYKTRFAKQMLSDPKCATLDSQPVIEGWCRQWEKTSVS